MLSILCVILCALLARSLASVDYGYDFFFPGTDFAITPDNCAQDSECSVYLVLDYPVKKDNNTDNGDDEEETVSNRFNIAFDGPTREFKLDFISSHIYALNNIDHIPDAQEQGIYPDSVFRVDYTNAALETVYSKPFTFYKSQIYMEFEEEDNDDENAEHQIILNVASNGVYSPSINTVNYMPNRRVNTYFNITDSKSDNLFIRLDYDGVKQCDHVVVYDSDKNGQILAMPTVFNTITNTTSSSTSAITDKVTSVSIGREGGHFQTEFVTDDVFSYHTFAPTLVYNSTFPNLDTSSVFSFLDFSWDVKNNDTSVEDEVDEEGILKFKRGEKINVSATMRINESMIDYIASKNIDQYNITDGNLFFTLAICHVNRVNDDWSFFIADTCTNSTYSYAPPYKCQITSLFDVDATNEDEKMTFTQSESTRNLGGIHSYYDLKKYPYTNETTADGKYTVRSYKFNITGFPTDEANPIPFRIVPLVSIYEKTDDEDVNGIKYNFVPIGPASKIYEITIDTIPALIFFIIIFVVTIVLCVAAFFIGSIIVKKVKENKSNKVSMHLVGDEQHSDVSMMDDESEDLIHSKKSSSSSSSSSDENKNVA